MCMHASISTHHHKPEQEVPNISYICSSTHMFQKGISLLLAIAHTKEESRKPLPWVAFRGWLVPSTHHHQEKRHLLCSERAGLGGPFLSDNSQPSLGMLWALAETWKDVMGSGARWAELLTLSWPGLNSTGLSWLFLVYTVCFSHSWARAMLSPSPTVLLPGHIWDSAGTGAAGGVSVTVWLVVTKGKVPNLPIAKVVFHSVGGWMHAFLSGLLKYQWWVPQMCL